MVRCIRKFTITFSHRSLVFVSRKRGRACLPSRLRKRSRQHFSMRRPSVKIRDASMLYNICITLCIHFHCHTLCNSVYAFHSLVSLIHPLSRLLFSLNFTVFLLITLTHAFLFLYPSVRAAYLLTFLMYFSYEKPEFIVSITISFRSASCLSLALFLASHFKTSHPELPIALFLCFSVYSSVAKLELYFKYILCRQIKCHKRVLIARQKARKRTNRIKGTIA